MTHSASPMSLLPQHGITMTQEQQVTSPPSNNTTPAVAVAASTPTSDAAGVAVTAVTGAAAIVSAAASTGASIALLSSLGSCDDDRPKDTVMVYVLSPFYSLGAVAIALGNVGLAMALTALHALLVVLHHRCTAHSQDAEDTEYSSLWVGHYHRSMPALRFPTLSLRVWQLMLPGAVFGSVVSVLGDDVRVEGIRNLGESAMIAAGSIALITVGLYHILEGWYFMMKIVLPSLTFLLWPRDVASILLHSTLDRYLLPEGRWVPSEIAELVAVPLLPMRGVRLARLRFLDTVVTYVLSVSAALSRSSSTSDACSAFPMVLAVMYFIHALVLVVFQPHRNPAERAAAPITDLCFGTMCLLKYINTGRDASSSLQLILSVIMIMSTVHSLWLRYRLSRALVHGDHVTTTDDHGGIPLLEIFTDGTVNGTKSLKVEKEDDVHFHQLQKHDPQDPTEAHDYCPPPPPLPLIVIPSDTVPHSPTFQRIETTANSPLEENIGTQDHSSDRTEPYLAVGTYSWPQPPLARQLLDFESMSSTNSDDFDDL
ncbi:transmembrane protein, putative [Bodo saltans]|uniref:Transmembrane protein, putative n=1 Tax=Bodo saltans TaxID=75058 RepID=A0A0S4IPB8_BODSA|nr:transmembrane protein, putative [Bodo saltans]|eukprot:CUE70659.1 transmembrane protein, putative [Bodo saltans]